MFMLVISAGSSPKQMVCIPPMSLFPFIEFTRIVLVTVSGQPVPPKSGKTFTLTTSLSFRDNEIVFTADGGPCVTLFTKNSKLLLTLPVAVNKKVSPSQAVSAGLSLVRVPVGAGPADTVTVTIPLIVEH